MNVLNKTNHILLIAGAFLLMFLAFPLSAQDNVKIPTTENSAKTDSRFALKTNLLGIPILDPNVEFEWMFVDRWSLALEWQGAWYAKDYPHKVYRISTVIPEARFWAIYKERWHGMYVGLFGGAGRYDLCNGKKGHKGELAMGGLSVGYMWPLNPDISLDTSIGLGYMRTQDKIYTPFDGHFLYQYTKRINYFGPLRLKVSLVWRIPSKKHKSVK